MIVVVSAGNEGNKPWQNVTPPSDARNVLAIGAVGTDSLIASFSSRGHMEDGRIKPDLVSVGKGTVTIGQEGQIGFTNGTSLLISISGRTDCVALVGKPGTASWRIDKNHQKII